MRSTSTPKPPNAFGPETREIGLVFAAHSSVAWNAARRDEQFKKALASRDVIGQAKGMLMERYGVNAIQAFELLRKLSQDSNTPLIQIATDLVEKQQSSADPNSRAVFRLIPTGEIHRA